MSELEKMNEAMYERLGEIVFKACDARTQCSDERICDQEKNLRLLAAITEIRQMSEFYKPEKPTDAEKAAREKAARQAYFNRRVWSFCDGLFPIRHIRTPEGFFEQCDINGRRFRASVTVDDVSGEWIGRIYDKDLCVCQLDGMGKGKIPVVRMTHAALRAYVKSLSGSGKYRNGRHYIEQARARAMAKTVEVK